MRRIALYIIVMLSAYSALAQSLLEQKGVTFRYNGKNPRTPLGGVYVKAATSPNGVVSDEQNGVFILKLQNIKMGDRLGRAMARKNGMMIFNQQAVDEWSARKEPLKLILCDADEFQKQKNNLIAIGRSQAEKKYRKKLAEIEKKNKAQQLTLDEYYAKLDSIDKELRNAQSHMEEYADMFARIDESEIDTLAQRAIELFNQGQLEESIKLFEQGNYLKKLDDDLKVKAQIADLRQKADSAETLVNKDIDEHTKSIQAQVAAYKMKNEWNKAGELLKGLADKLQTLDAIWDYAYFAQSQNMFTEAEKEYELYIKKILADTNSQAYKPDLAASYNNLANLYKNTQRFKEAEQMHTAALEIRKRLAEANPQAYEPDLAMSYNNLAILYYTTQRFKEAEQMYKAALEIYKRLAEANPQLYSSKQAECLFGLADSQIKQEKYSEAIAPLEEALGFYKKEAEQGASTDYYYDAISWLHQLYSQKKKYSKAYQFIKQNIPTLRALYQSDKSNYAELMNGILISQSFYSIFEKQYAEAEAYSKEALEVDSTKHIAYSNLASALLFQGKYQEAEKVYRQYKSELKEGFLSDFEEFTKAGVIPKNREEDVEKIKKMLNE